MHALVTMLVPFLAMAVPLADTAFAFIRRILHGQSPFHADKGHFHHRLLAMGLTQKQAVTVIYGISILLGIFAYLMIGKTRNVKIICLIVAFVMVFSIVVYVLKIYPRTHAKRLSSPGVQEDDIKIYHKKGSQKR
jgi:UDP-GlcNAc:undecaprenyl-phosphate GlcNAc-1-phosphate transferase